MRVCVFVLFVWALNFYICVSASFSLLHPLTASAYLSLFLSLSLRLFVSIFCTHADDLLPLLRC